MDVPDGDLVRLARTGDQVAFRLLIERHRPTARRRAAGLTADEHEVDDVVQEAFLQALISLGRLRDPDRFGAWLGGIVVNVHRRMWRRAPLTLVGEWPEALQPESAAGLPSADELDRAEAVRAAVAVLPAGQRNAVEVFYHADQPASEIAGSPGAARASLHKARRRLRAYLTEHRPDLIPVSRRTPMTAVRIAHAEPMPGAQPAGNFNFNQVLVVLADDRRGRALPIWLSGADGESLWRLADRPRGDSERSALPPEATAEELTGRLLDAAGIAVTGVDIDELGPQVTAARIGFTGPGGTRHVLGRLAARTLWAMFHRHPWLAPSLSVTRPQPIARGLACAEWVLSALDGRGLDTSTMLTIHITLFNYVHGTAMNLELEADAEAASGLDREEWLEAQGSALRSAIKGSRAPVFERLTATDYDFSLENLFEFGLQRLLDGLAPIVGGRP